MTEIDKEAIAFANVWFKEMNKTKIKMFIKYENSSYLYNISI